MRLRCSSKTFFVLTSAISAAVLEVDGTAEFEFQHMQLGEGGFHSRGVLAVLLCDAKLCTQASLGLPSKGGASKGGTLCCIS